MANEEKRLLNDEALAAVNGGLLKASDQFTLKRNEFENAWKILKLDDEQISGMRMAEIFDEWELNEFKPDALAFLRSQNL